MNRNTKLTTIATACMAAAISANSWGLAMQTDKNSFSPYPYHYVNKWPYGCVPFEYKGSFLGSDDNKVEKRAIFESAVGEWNSKVDNLFIFNRKNPPNNTPSECLTLDVYIEIGSGAGCSVTNNVSHGAFAENEDQVKRVLSLRDDDYNIEFQGKKIEGEFCFHANKSDISRLRAATHELGHALGFVHEQQRADAGRYIKFNADNVSNGGEFVPESINGGNLTNEYDYFSIMHYGTRQAALNSYQTDTDGNFLRDADGNLIPTPYQDRLIVLEPINPGSGSRPTLAEMEAYQLSTPGISELDASAANAFYAPGKADIGVQLVKIRGCSQTRLDNGQCEAGEVAHQIIFKGVTVNHGAYDSGQVEVNFTLPSITKSVEVVQAGHDSCSAEGASIRCRSSNMKPGQVKETEIKLILDGSQANVDKDQPYAIKVNEVAALDEQNYNDKHDIAMKTDTPVPSCGCSGCPPREGDARFTGIDPTLPAFMVFALGGGLITKKRKKLGVRK